MPDYFNWFIKAIAHLAELANCYEQFVMFQEQFEYEAENLTIADATTVFENVIHRRRMLQDELEQIDRRMSEVQRAYGRMVIELKAIETDTTEGTEPR